MRLAAASLTVLCFFGCDSTAVRASDGAPLWRRAEANARLMSYESELRRVQIEVAQAEEAVRKARAEAEFEQCRATVERIRADVTASRMRCARAAAVTARCLARQDEKRANGAAGGALLGLGLAIVTGGAALPLAAGGLVVGSAAGEADTAECPPPRCLSQQATLEATTIAAEGLSELPTCGGYAGFAVRPVTESIVALPVVEVGPGTAAEAAGIREGDLLVQMGGKRFVQPHQLTESLDHAAIGDRVAIGIVRAGGYGELAVTLGDLSVDGELRGDRGYLGLRLGPAVRTQYESSAEVTWVDDAGPGAGKMRIGDRVEVAAPSGEPTAPSVGVADAIRLARVGEEIELLIAADDAPDPATIVLAAQPATRRPGAL